MCLFSCHPQGDSQLQLHVREVLPDYPSAGQQQREAGSLRGRAAERRGHPPRIHYAVRHPWSLTGLKLCPGEVLILLLSAGITTPRCVIHLSRLRPNPPALKGKLFLSPQEPGGKGDAGNHCFLQSQGQPDGVRRRVRLN